MSFEAMFFDLDDTLYPSTSGVWNAIGERMDRYMVEELGFPCDSVRDLRNSLFREYGTTLRGLKAVYDIDEMAFLDYVHDIPLSRYIMRDEALIDTLNCYTDRKLIFTNANRSHSQRVLSTLGVGEVFEQIIDIMDISPYCKPFPEAYQRALDLSGVKDVNQCVVIDDSVRNLETASRLGFFTIQVGTDARSPYADACIMTIADLPDVIPVQTKNERGIS